ncbi:PEP-CTERM sorting domain-containing protein [Leptothermofonsia sichuanensis E412]|uniref:Vgb family protein n=1 Tax=Leptothermofonsia sichuanensis TaxID=2917832 RepID=UPI001CA668BA|nr:PEP-CTERM sorting domain-containing protein [Leptothermofonsia sichuanensis]QZZ20782.1 PEP-CTERM sorting domain-containing protein [Leptothermofonsia sichuanensis E412]
MKISHTAPLILSVITVLGLVAPKAEAFLLISNSESNNIVVFDETTGQFLGDFTTPGLGGLRAPDDLTFGPDGNLYVSIGGSNSLSLLDPTYPQDSAVLKFSPSGQFLGVAASGNGLARPYGNAFGPDGNLYVSSFRSNQILRFNGQTGEFIDVFASDNNNGLGSIGGVNGPNGLLFGPDGSLYVTIEGTANALDESFGFVSLLGIVLAPDEQSFFVSDFAGGIREYALVGNLVNVLSTNYTGTAPSNNFIGSLTFGIGSTANNLYVIGFDFTNENEGSVLEFGNGQGSPTSFTGTLFTSPSLLRPIGVVAAIPEPSTIAGILLGCSGLGATWLRKRRGKGGKG